MSDSIIRHVDSHKDLGVILSEDLSWEKHHKTIITREVDNNNNISLLRWPLQSWLRAWRLAGIWVACGSSHDGVGFFSPLLGICPVSL